MRLVDEIEKWISDAVEKAIPDPNPKLGRSAPKTQVTRKHTRPSHRPLQSVIDALPNKCAIASLSTEIQGYTPEEELRLIYLKEKMKYQ